MDYVFEAFNKLLEKYREKEKQLTDRILGNKRPSRRHKLTNLPSTEPCKNFEELQEYCYKEWKMSEGRCSDIYTDIKGLPSTGTGFLIYSPNGNGSDESQKERFVRMDFAMNGKSLTTKQKEALFDRIVKDYKANKLGKSKRNLYPQYSLTDKGHKEEFNRRFEAWYNKYAIKHHPDLHNMPRSMAQTLMHLYWWGKNKLAKEITGSFVHQANQIALCMKGGGKYGTKGNKQSLRDAQQAIDDAKAVSSVTVNKKTTSRSL